MGATCTKIKREKVIQPIKASNSFSNPQSRQIAIEDPTQPESLSADGKKRLEIENKKSSKVRKDSGKFPFLPFMTLHQMVQLMLAVHLINRQVNNKRKSSNS